MATAFLGTKAQPGVQPHFLPAGAVSVYSSYTIAAALVISDTMQMMTIPAGARLIDLVLDSTDLDTGGTPVITLDVGTAGTSALFIASATIGQASGITRMSVAGSCGYAFSVDTAIIVKVAAAPQTGATTGTVGLAVTFVLDDPYRI